MGVVDLKGKPMVLRDFGQLAEKQRINCQFTKVDEMRFKPFNEAARTLTELCTCLGWLSAKRLEQAAKFAEIEIMDRRTI